MIRFGLLTALALAIGTAGCQREYIASDDPRYPTGLESSSPLGFWKQRSESKTLKKLAGGERTAEVQTGETR